MTYESRVLAVLDPSTLKSTSQVIREARMAPAICLSTLGLLVDLRVVDRFTASTTGRGRPAILYRRRQVRESAA